MQLEQKPTKTPAEQADLTTKKQQLQDLEKKQKELDQPLPINSIDSQITNLAREIKELASKSTRTPTEEALLVEKRKQLEGLLKKQQGANTTNHTKPSDKTVLYLGLGIGGVIILVLVIFILKRTRKRPI